MYTLLQINSVVNTGSTGRIAEQLGQMAMSQGWKSYIAYGREIRASKSQLIRIGSGLDVNLHAIGSILLDRHGLFSKIVTRKFLRQVDKIKPDVVHLHNIHGYYINYPMLLNYLREKNIPTVISMHDFWLMTGHCAYINNSCDRWKTGCGNCPRLNQYPSAKIDRSAKNWQIKQQLFSNITNVTLVPVSNWLNGYVQQSLLRSVKSYVVYNGIDTEVFKPYNQKESMVKNVNWGKFTIMCVATRWTDANGFNDVLHLSKLLPADAQIVLVGLDEKHIKQLPNNIIGFKKIESLSQLQELYSKANVIFNPNTEVTFGLVTAEAMACGTPVIVLSDTAGEEIVDEETGYVVDSVDEIPDLIPVIRVNAGSILSKKCRNRVIENFKADSQYQKCIDLYQLLIKKR